MIKFISKKNNLALRTLLPAALFLLAVSYGFSQAQVAAPAANQLSISAYIVGGSNDQIPNGDYDVRFAIYSKDRSDIDPFPSNADAGSRVWMENQKVSIQDGMLSTYLGSTNPLPASLNFNDGTYYLGIQIGSDSEMVPRKKIAAVPAAINSLFLQGKTIGNQAGDIPEISSNGSLDPAILKKINQLGNVTSGTWQATAIADKYIAKDLTGKTYNGVELGNNGTLHRLNISADATIDQNLAMAASPIFNGLTLTNALSPRNGGTGFSTYALGDILYGSTDGRLAKLGVGANDEVLAIIGGVPTWKSVALGSELLGVLPIANGGTGRDSYSSGSIIFSDGTVLSQNNADFFWDNANRRLKVGSLNGVLRGTNGMISDDANTSDLPEGTNQYFTDARARNTLSSAITGITYTNTTGVFSLASGYAI
ncbi:MAG TPA: hypothetical protein VF817_03610, partial [Patescibacteria group bacterium]